MTFGERPKVPAVDPEFYKVLGEEGFRAFISDFYDIVIEDDDISHFFPQDEKELAQAKQNASDFFIQHCGGPKWFDERRGGISMDQAHDRFSVTEESREGWLHCLRMALDNLNLDEALKLSYWHSVEVFSKHIVNIKPKGKSNTELWSGSL
jgi:hemoglobin